MKIKNVLIQQQRSSTVSVLQGQDCKIMSAEDGIDCIRKTIRYRPDLIIIRVDAPKLNGFSMASILQMLKITTPIIFTSPLEKYAQKAKQIPNLIGYLVNSEITTKLPFIFGQLEEIEADNQGTRDL
jgi:two-component SAPR family response regulator